MAFEASIDFARQLDSKDPLAELRKEYYLPKFGDEDQVYFCGNSLGLQPKNTEKYLQEELNAWKKYGVEGHFEGKNPWFHYHHFLQKQAANIVGAKKEEVVMMNSLSTNIHLLLVSFYRPTTKRFKIIVEKTAFPSDQYIVESQAKFHGFDPKDAIIEIPYDEGKQYSSTETVLKTMEEHKDTCALVFLGAVNYYNGQFFDLENITKKGHSIGAVVGYDLAHTTGNIPLELHRWGVDFAAWCSYKYLNSGPGGISGIFVHEKHGNNPDLPRFAGWWGHKEEERFQMKKGFIPMQGAAGWQLSNAPVLNMAAHMASLELFEKVGMKALRDKSVQLSAYAEFLVHTLNKDKGREVLKIITPSDPERRGCQLSMIAEKDGKKIFDAISKKGVVADWREPDVIRIAPVPMYNSFEDVFKFYLALKESIA